MGGTAFEFVRKLEVRSTGELLMLARRFPHWLDAQRAAFAQFPMIPAMKAAILAVGSELLGTDRLDTNSLRITATLERYGVELRRKSVAGDAVEEIAAMVAWLLA